MARKRASLKDKGEEILGVKRGGQGTEILFGSGEGSKPQARPQASSRAAAAAAAMPPEGGEADLDREVDLDSLLGAEAEAAGGGGEAALPALATTPASPRPPSAGPVTAPQGVVRPSPAPPPTTLPEPVVSTVVTRPPSASLPAAAAGASTYPIPPQSPAAVSPVPASVPPVAPVAPVQPASISSVPAAPPSTATGAPDLSAPRPLQRVSLVGKDFDLLAEDVSPDAASAALVGIPQGVDLTPEERAQQLRRPSVQKKLTELDRAIAGQYDRILQDNVSVSQPITDWCQNMLAEARTIVLNLQIEKLAKAEWDVEQVRARLDRAAESRKQANRFAWPIIIWGVIWFVAFVYLIFNTTLVLQLLNVTSRSDELLNPEIFMQSLFFGGIGGVAAVFYHLFKYMPERNFDSQYVLSYFGKPIMGMILGSIIYLALFGARFVGLAVFGSQQVGTDLTGLKFVVWVFAIATGFKENLAFDMLNRVIKTVLGDEQPPEQGSAPPSTTSASGK
jgi:hypothetical protein